MIFARRALLLVLLAATATCGDDPVGPSASVATTVAITPSALGLSALGETALVDATVLDQNGATMAVDPVWSSADPLVASVTSQGLVTATGDGVTTLSATSGGATGTVSVSVSRTAAAVVLGADSIVLDDPGDGATLMVFVADAGGAEVTDPGVAWSSSDPSVATVDTAGTVTAVATGTALVVATSGAASDTLGVRVAPRLVLSAAGPPDRQGEVATEVALSVRVDDVAGPAYAGATVQWSADAGTIVSAVTSVSDPTGHSGAVWRLGSTAGAQTARATLVTRGDTLTVEFAATATAGAAVDAVLIADTVLLSAVRETAFLSPTYYDPYGNATSGSGVTWVSRDSTIVTVAPDGLLTGVAPGAAWVVGSLGAPVDSVEVSVVPRGAITVTFDDGWRSVYDNAWPIFQDFPFRANVGVYTEAVGWPAYMTEAHLQELHDAGWSMVSHSVTHDTLPNLDDAGLDYELRASRAWLDARGFSGSNVFVLPYHAYDDRVRLAVGGYYTAARGLSADEFVPDSLVSWIPSNPYLLRGIEAEKLPYTTPAGRDRLRTLLQRAVDEGAFLDVFFHQVPAADTAAFRATLQVVDEFRDRVLPYRELFPIWARGVF